MALDKEKCDKELGIKVNKYLEKVGVQTPINDLRIKKSEENKIELIKYNFESIMRILGLDLNDDSLQDTPKRVAKMFIKEIYWGLIPENFPKCTVVANKMNYDELVIERNITSVSNCEHHFVVINGKCHIGYIPNKKVLGLSKLNRIVEYFSRRPQIQERLSLQIYYALNYILDTKDIAVVLEGEHYCVKSRGVEDSSSDTVTSKMGGIFLTDSDLRKEFMELIRK